MKLVLAKSICEREFGSADVPDPVGKVLRRSMRADLATTIKGEGLPPATRLLKVYATSADGPRRIVYLFAVRDDTLFLLFYRNKNDPVGANVTIKNREFRRQLHHHLDLLQSDIEAGHFVVWDNA